LSIQSMLTHAPDLSRQDFDRIIKCD
jgi:hypothetical protein